MSETDGNFGKVCVFLSRSCGVLSSVIILLCGFIALIPLPFPKSVCIVMGLILIISAVVMFFLEATVIGYCIDQLKFLLLINKYMRNWIRATLYMGMAIVLVTLVNWCVGASTIIGLGIMFLVGALNFVLAVGTKGDHSQESYSRVKMSDLGQGEEGRGDGDGGVEDTKEEEEEEEETELYTYEQQ